MEPEQHVKHAQPKVLTDGELKQALRDLPLPEPDAAFERRMLRRVMASQAPGALAGLSQRWRWPVAAAVALLLAVLLAGGGQWDPAPTATGSLAPQMVHIVLDSPRRMHGATIRVTLPAGATLAGYRDVGMLQWQADISAGGNRLTLPLLAPQGDSGGTIQVEIEHDGARKALEFPIPSRSVDGGGAPITKT